MTGRTPLVVVGLVCLGLGLAAGLLLAGLLLRPAVPAEGSVDAGFARDMQVHHAQAVEMAVLVRDRSEDDEVRQLALDIMLTQQQQQGQLFGWLAVWGLPQASTAPRMAWMDEGHGSSHADDVQDGLMPGMASAEQLDRLRAADGVEADRIFLELMLRHHVGGLEMAEIGAERATQPAVRRLAQAILDAQSAELTVLERMLGERGGAPADL